MSAHHNAREVLIAEAIGDLGRLLEQAEALQPALHESTQALINARIQLAEQFSTFDAHLLTLAQKAKVGTVKYVVARTEEAARQSVQAQNRAMADTAHTLFKAEITPALQRFASSLHELIKRADRPWEQWLTHAATASVASTITLALTIWAFGA